MSSTRRQIRKILKRYKIKPLKRLGQNFLVDKRVLNKIVEAAELKLGDVVLEIGPGIGNLTLELAKRVKKVIAVEKDEKMCQILNETLGEFKNVKIIKEDILKIFNFPPPQNFGAGFNQFTIFNYKIVANIPYYLTSPLIRKFLETENKPKVIVLLVQKEVAQRIVARPPDMNLLAVSVQFYAKPEIISYVSKKSFWPQPKVDSAIIKITPLNKTRNVLVLLFFRIVKAGFSHPRKQLLNNLAKGLKLNREEVMAWLLKNKVKPCQRAETLSIEDWLNLTKSFKI